MPRKTLADLEPPELKLPLATRKLVQHYRSAWHGLLSALPAGFHRSVAEHHLQIETLEALATSISVDGDLELLAVMEQVKNEYQRLLVQLRVDMGKRAREHQRRKST